MDLRLCSADEYYGLLPHCASVFDSRAFVYANAQRAKAVRHFISRDAHGRPRMGITLGLADDDAWRCPFSAPFGAPAWTAPLPVEEIRDFFAELQAMLAPRQLSVTLPPAFYSPELVTRCSLVLSNMASRSYNDFNYHYPLQQAADPERWLDRAARKNLRRAMQQPFRFEATDDDARAYAVIQANRESRGYPLAMSLGQVMATVRTSDSGPQPVRGQFFILTLEGADVAAAMVYDVAPGIAQVVYWGDAPGFSLLRPMNIFPILLFRHYAAMGYSILDIGPSSKHGIPSPGLCRFKESLGCRLSPKPTYIILP